MADDRKELSDVLTALGAGPLRRFFHRDGAAMERTEMHRRLESMRSNSVAKSMLWSIENREIPYTLDKYRILMEEDGKYRAVRVYGFFTD